MKWFVLLACWVVLGCGVIYGIVHGIVPHLLTPELFPKAQAREAPGVSLEHTLTDAGHAVRGGVAANEDTLAAR